MFKHLLASQIEVFHKILDIVLFIGWVEVEDIAWLILQIGLEIDDKCCSLRDVCEVLD